jgi:V/A-type H+-transporting ATPase subunit E
METDKIREAILKKAKGEADKIVADAEIKARETIEKAKDQWKNKFEEEKKKIISEAHREASRIMAQTSLKTRQGILQEKDNVINVITENVKKELSEEVMDSKMFLPLIKETIDAFETDKQVIIYVAPKDIKVVHEIIKEDSELKEKIFEVKELDCLGGIIAESTDGMVSIDNTFDMRLEMLMPKILPDLGKKLFGVGEH